MNSQLAFVVLQEAETYLAAGDLDRASMCFKKAFELDPTSVAPALGIARIGILLKDYLKARALLEETLIRHPSSAEAMTFLGVVEEANQALERASKWYDKAVKTNPSCAAAQFNLGRMLAGKGKWDEAYTVLQTAVHLEPTSYPFRYLLGTAAFNARRLPEAVAAFAECVRLSPNNVDAYATLADALAEVGQADLAVQTLEVGCERSPKAAILYSKRAAMEIRASNPMGAIAHCQKAYALEPTAVEYATQLAVAHSMVAQFGQATEVLSKAIAMAPKDWKLRFHLGAIFEAVGEREAAKLNYRKAIELNGDAWKPKNNLGSMLMEEQKPEALKEALKLLDDAVTLAPKTEVFPAFYNLALAHWNLGDKVKSRRAAQEVVAHGPQSDETTFLAKKFLEKMAP